MASTKQKLISWDLLKSLMGSLMILQKDETRQYSTFTMSKIKAWST